MFSSLEVVRPLVAKPSPSSPTKKASSPSSSSSSSSSPLSSVSDTTPRIKNPKDQEQPMADTTTTTHVVQDYVQNFTALASTCIDTAYCMPRSIHQSPRTGRLSTCLPEDIFTLLDIQYHSFLDFLLDNGFATTNTTTTTNIHLTVEGQGLLMGTLVFLFRQIQETQERFRPLILNSSSRNSNNNNSTSSHGRNNNKNNAVGIEECCAAANDFLLMSEKMEVFLERLLQRHDFLTLTNQHNHSNSNSNTNNDDDHRDDINAATVDTTTTTSTTTSLVQQAGADLILRWSQDAVIAVERVQVVWMRHVHTQTYIATDLFSPSWEKDWTHNDVILDLLQSLHDIVLGPMEDYYLGGGSDEGNDDSDDDGGGNPNQVLYEKALVACCRAVVCFYIQCLVQKADAIRRGRRRNAGPAAALRRRAYQLAPPNSSTSNNTATAVDAESSSLSPPYEQAFKFASRAVLRMTGDVQLIQEFFLEKTSSISAALSRIVGDEMRILELIQECLTTTILPHRLHLQGADEPNGTTTTSMSTTTSTTNNGTSYNYSHADADSLESFIVVIHKRIGADPLVTNMFMNDLWLLVAASSNTTSSSYKSKEGLDQTISTVEQDLHMVSRGMRELGNSSAHSTGAAAAASSSSGVLGDVSFVRLDEMLKAIYEDRLVQGVLPLSICWNCLPKTPKCSTTNANEEIVSQKIRTWTRNLTELRRWKFTNHLKPKPKQQPAQRHLKNAATTTKTTTKMAAAKTTTTTATATTATANSTTTTATATPAIKKTTTTTTKPATMERKMKSSKTSLPFSNTAAEI